MFEQEKYNDADTLACVGTNGQYGPEVYIDGYCQAVKTLCGTVRRDLGYADSLIYPIAFNARHAIELYLKECIKQVQEIYTITNISFPGSCPKSPYTHEVRFLCSNLECYSKIDERIIDWCAKVKDLNIIKFIIEYDESGAVFRYREEKTGLNHLDNKLDTINIARIHETFNRASDFLSNLLHFLIIIVDEYHRKTFVVKDMKVFSRAFISDFSKELPSYGDWETPAFTSARFSLMEKYSINSKTTFSKILDKIKNNYEFASNINFPFPIEHLDERSLEILIFANMNNPYNHEVGVITLADGKDTIRRGLIIEVEKLLSNESLTCFFVLFEIGGAYSDSYYPEDYEELFAINLDNPKRDKIIKLIGRHAIFYLKKGLDISGQKTMVEKINKEYSAPPIKSKPISIVLKEMQKYFSEEEKQNV